MRKPWRWMLPVLALVLTAAVLSLRIAPQHTQAPDSAALGLLLLDTEAGVQVLAVSEGSMADACGLLPGDCILAADGTPLQDADAFNACLLAQPEALCLTVQRDERQLEVTLRRR